MNTTAAKGSTAPARSIGVAVPTLNSGKTLDWTLLSLARQEGVAVQIVVADSGSTDDTLAICGRWGVPTIFVPRGNMYRAVNAALRTMDTPWLTYLNSDDLVFPRSYARLIGEAERQSADIAYGHADFIDEEGRYLYSMRPASPAKLGAIFRQGVMPFAQPAALFRREVFTTLGEFSEEGRSVSDFDFFVRAERHGYKMVTLPKPSVAAFRVHDQQLSYAQLDLAHEETARVLAANAATSPVDVIRRWQWRIGNAAEYLQRVLRTGNLRQR